MPRTAPKRSMIRVTSSNQKPFSAPVSTTSATGATPHRREDPVQNIKTLTTQLQQKSGEQSQTERLDDKRRALGLPAETASRGNLRERHFDRLWERMSETFGHSWVSSFGTEPNAAWIDGLSDLNEEDIVFGLGALKGWKSDFPPNLLQFRALCRPAIEESHRIHRPALPEPPESRAKRMQSGREAIAAIAARLKQNPW